MLWHRHHHYTQEFVALFTTEPQNYISKKHSNCKVYPAPFAVFIKDDDSNYIEPDISIVCDPDKFPIVAVKEPLILSSKLFLRAVVKWITPRKIFSMPMQVSENIGL